MKNVYWIVMLVLISSCRVGPEAKITIETKNSPAAEDNSTGNSSGNSSENLANDSGSNSTDDSANGGSSESENSDESGGSNSSSSSDESNSVSLIFEEDFQYTLSDGTSINSSFLTDSNFTSKWSTYSSTHQLHNRNGSIQWSAIGSSWWGASIITNQTFNLPITIEWDMEQASFYSGTSAFEGLCLYEGSATSRNSYYKFAEGGSNYGCILLGTGLSFYVYGLFKDTSNPNLIVHSNGVLYYHNQPNSVRNYRITINIYEDSTFEVTMQFKDEPSVPQLVYSGSLQLSDPNNGLDNFKLEFNQADYGGYRTYFDNIKVWDGDMSPTPL